MAKRIPIDKWVDWWAAADRKIIKHRAKKKGWLKRKLHSIYNMGKNINIVLQWKLGKKDINWLALPGKENCSGFVAGINGAGFDAIGWPQLYPFESMPHVYETADVAPGHFGWSKYYRRLKPGEPIRAGCVKLSISWGNPQSDNIDSILRKLASTFLLIKTPVLFFVKLWRESPGLFRDGIKITQRDRYKISHPYWQATHIEFIKRNDNGRLLIAGQEAFLKEYAVDQDVVYANMRGDTSKTIILEPNFLYGI